MYHISNQISKTGISTIIDKGAERKGTESLTELEACLNNRNKSQIFKFFKGTKLPNVTDIREISPGENTKDMQKRLQLF